MEWCSEKAEPNKNLDSQSLQFIGNLGYLSITMQKIEFQTVVGSTKAIHRKF